MAPPAADPQAAQGLLALAQLAGSRGELAQALQLLQQARVLAPSNPEIVFRQGLAQRALGDEPAALASFDAALALAPGNPAVLNARGLALKAQGRNVEALAAYDQALERVPRFAEALNNRGVVLRLLDRLEEAAASFRAAAEAQPNAAEIHNNLGWTLHRLDRHDEALAAYAQALRLAPGNPDFAVNHGNALLEAGRAEDALAAFEIARAARPDDAMLEMNIANAWRELQQGAQALPHYERALALEPGNADVRFNQALALLAAGDFERGWVAHEARWQAPGLGIDERVYAAPKWLGEESIAGRTLLLHAEQGLGDTLWLCRYAPLAAAQGARVLLLVQKPLVALLREALAGVQVLGPDDALPPFDLHCPLMSLPLAFGTTLASVPASPRYLQPAPQRVARWRAVLAADRPNIGLAWSGNPANPADRSRSVRLAALLPALPRGPQYWCLQKDVPPADRDAFEADGRIALFEENGFADTAAQAVLMDRVIAVDTSIAHLCCAVGCATEILLAFSADLRWLTGRADSPWYPAARLWRQPRPGDWGIVLQRLGESL
ncbi:MAG: FlbA protein-like protein [Ramlibacter sp.]|nr:FlbA protein-like protein [Ramlibacter sp.]